VVINDWWEWPLLVSRCFSSGAATITRVIAVKNRSHNPNKAEIKLQSFFLDQTGRSPKAGKLFRPAAELNFEPLNPGTVYRRSDRRSQYRGEECLGSYCFVLPAMSLANFIPRFMFYKKITKSIYIDLL
jgi:hypothetical protein